MSVTELNTMLNKFGEMQQMMKKMGKFQKMMGKMGGGNFQRSMNDKQIRVAVHQKLFRHYSATPNTLVLEEVGLRHGAARVDFLVVNGMLHGFELKSDRDNLIRLENQIPIYCSVLDRVKYSRVDNAASNLPDSAIGRLRLHTTNC